MGDFNPYVEREDDPDAFQFKEMLQARGLKQSVDFPSYRSGGTLDFIIT